MRGGSWQRRTARFIGRGIPAADRARVAEVVEEVGAGLLVVGLPLSMDGAVGAAASAALAEAEALREVVGVPVELQDERLTSVSANRSLAAAGVTGKRRRRAARASGAVDQAAAAIVLQSWLDGHRQGSRNGGAR